MYTMLYGNKWIKAAWKKELLKETNSIKDKVITMHVLYFEEDCILLDGKKIEKD